jgi:hypothetical protein
LKKYEEQGAEANKSNEEENKGEGEEGKDDKDDILDSLFSEEEIKKEEEKESEKKEPEKKSEEEEEDDISEEDKKMVEKVLGKRLEEGLAPYKQEVAKAREEKLNSGFDNFVKENPQFEKYKDNIKPYIAPLYDTFVKNGVTLENGKVLKVAEGKYNDFVTALILGRGMLKVGAQMRANADSKAGADSQASSSYRPTEKASGIPDVKNMSKDDFAKLQQDVMSGNFKEK